ncbi:hypothetical protein PIB30_012480 [Stylosanthes scabra]|uniref:Uncharacterized protein n=1 Tax=Stylosanthes scabra TaxID=79078 RepID=A0ABU6T5W4_9FABA|nr:hypothetical protein [Stylosanthes scabra]
MVELQSCATLVNTSALCVIEQEVKGESVDVVAEISAELERERQKNSELMKRISLLEAQIRERNMETQESHHQHASARRSKKFKRQKIEQETDEEENKNNVKSEMASQYRPGIDPAKCLIKWMSTDDNNGQNLYLGKFKDSESVADFNETDSEDDCDDNYDHDRVSQRQEEIEGITETVNEQKGYPADHIDVESNIACMESFSNHQSYLAGNEKQEDHENQKTNHSEKTAFEEHVLYENRGVRRKIFYPNRENLVLCPVQILEEENAMRPCDPTCPSCLFLCIKYGGRTRNLPQNEYVRQRMGRNKLKSFGPLMCQMGMLVHIRSGSFFFKALGITLLFMAGVPDDLVQRETKYHNLDLLHKYYRTDEDAEGEQLFLPNPIACDNEGSQNPQNLTRKTVAAKSKGRKNTSSDILKLHSSQNAASYHQLTPTSSAQTQFCLSGYPSAYTYTNAMAAFHSIPFPSQISQDTPHPMPNPILATGNHNSNCMLPPQPANAIVPVMYWAPPNAYVHGPYPSAYGFQSLPCAASYMPFHTTQPYYNHPSCSSTLPKLLEGTGKNDLASEQCDSDTDSTEDHTATMACHK